MNRRAALRRLPFEARRTPCRGETLPRRGGASCAPLRVLLCLSVAAAFRVFGLELVFDELPPTEREARIRLEEGELDSSTWEVVRDFYDEPLCVPLGELRYLSDLMSWPDTRLPVTSRELSRYEPWSDDDISRFFLDFPQLQALKPILSFESRNTPHIGIVGFSSSTRSVSATPRQSLRCNVRPVNPLRFEGSADFEAGDARWERRRLSARIPALGHLQLGNFSVNPGWGLLFGYFPTSPDTRVSVGKNWLHGDSRTWNGLATDTRIGSRTELLTFVHHRPTESALGLETNLRIASSCRLTCGIAGLDAEAQGQRRDTSGMAYAGASVSVGLWEAEAQTAANFADFLSAPVVVDVRRRTEAAGLDARVLRVPAGFHAPRSRLVHEIGERFEVEDSVDGDVLGFDVAYEQTFSEYLSHAARVLYLIGESETSLEASWGLSGSFPVQYVLKYYYLPGLRDVRPESERQIVAVGVGLLFLESGLISEGEGDRGMRSRPVGRNDVVAVGFVFGEQQG
jgi:hypothetical protein